MLFIFLQLVCLAYGQSDKDLVIQAALNAENIEEIESVNGKYKFERQHWDRLNYGLVQYNYQLSRRRKQERVCLLVVSFNSKIVYSELYRYDGNSHFLDDEENEPFWIYQELSSNSREYFSNKKLNANHLTRLPYRSTFGLACSAGAGLPDEGQLMLEFVENRNLTELESWLNSISPVRQAYAYLGFALIEAEGVPVGSKIKNQMNELLASDAEVYSCSGCTDWGVKPLSVMLNEDQVQRFVEKYSK
ncbi:hypothetical protein [Reichenbachiella ulvae]|uniref:Uncharacterized protein n=1 Tax=Reichenbachiella ulvae TaxID=2980104 RepID=A0ABT3CZZ1_9BACT|nr:hypothetical protein [Reichenbachiella ulvae]MCV9389089.1 hypothetical protein [Reichenbachiella ulvae]